ncbi:MAG: hypothetical protein N3D74_02470 [Caldisericia bacterium]|nr:hypothetical protein [Caldisericia bacterium]
MNIDELIKEIEIEGEEEIKNLNEKFNQEIEKLKKDYEEKVKFIQLKWNELIEKEKTSFREKKELDIKNKIELIILNFKNEILESFKSYSYQLLESLSVKNLRDFYKKEIIKNVESSDVEVHFDKKIKEIFNENFKKEITEEIEKRFPNTHIKFIEDNEVFVKGKSYISKISLVDKFNEIFNENILKISKIIFEET